MSTPTLPRRPAADQICRTQRDIDRAAREIARLNNRLIIASTRQQRRRALLRHLLTLNQTGGDN